MSFNLWYIHSIKKYLINFTIPRKKKDSEIILKKQANNYSY